MSVRRRRKPAPPLDEKRLSELALAYVGRFATSRAKLRAYLARKIRERGWAGAEEPDAAKIAERFASQGYIDDAGFALTKAQGLTARGYGKRRLAEQLKAAGIEEQDAAAARRHADEEAVAAALRFAERRRIGPFAAEAADPKQREKALAAMVRAGHDFSLARAVVGLAPGSSPDLDELRENAGLTLN